MKPCLGLRGGWLILRVSVAGATDMTLFDYDQGVCGLDDSAQIALAGTKLVQY